MSTVRAKFVCTASNAGTVILIPVVASTDNAENTAFYEATPGGSMALQGLKPEVQEQFTQGQSYYIDFTPA
jgi:hypothetical protein